MGIEYAKIMIPINLKKKRRRKEVNKIIKILISCFILFAYDN